MHRPAALLLSALLAAFAATAPLPAPKASNVWVTGWDKPVDRFGDCRFDRDGRG
jgi:hypothetical protein